MTVLRPPRPRQVERALRDAQQWCNGCLIDDRPALVHAVRVAVSIGEHAPDAPPTLIAAALLHDAPELVPTGVDLDQVLEDRHGPMVRRIVRAMEAEHRALDGPAPIVEIGDSLVLLASTADKIVALTSLARRARATGAAVTFFAARPTLRALMPHFAAFRDAGAGRVPAGMTDSLTTAIDTIHLLAAGR